MKLELRWHSGPQNTLHRVLKVYWASSVHCDSDRDQGDSRKNEENWENPSRTPTSLSDKLFRKYKTWEIRSDFQVILGLG